MVIGSITLLVFCFFQYVEYAKTDFPQDIWDRLAKVRSEKRERLTRYFAEIQGKAGKIKNDQKMLSYFGFFQQSQSADGSRDEYGLDKYYVENYSLFYDILFVDPNGWVFHSIRKESDYQKNIFTGDLAETPLAQGMKRKRNPHFIEYQYYPPSDEPAAFFAVPLHEQGQFLGWFVLQCPINRVNAILTDRDSMGCTGEVYLVNQDELMLSDSRFIEDSTILKLKVDTQAVKKALRDGAGERLIRDYRGVNVFSSFECFRLFGTSWVLIAEIDEDEILTEYYRNDKKALSQEILRFLAHSSRKKSIEERDDRLGKRVDINEFARAEPGEMLSTRGVATCMAIAVVLPGKFGYLAHIAPTDDIYISDQLTQWLLGDNATDFWGELIGRIEHFDVYPYQRKELEIILVASHDKSFVRAVDKILERGINLSRIKFLYHPQAHGANVWLDMAKNDLQVEWYSNRFSFFENAARVDDLATIIKKVRHLTFSAES